MRHSTCVQIGRIGFCFVALSVATFVGLAIDMVPIDAAAFAIALFACTGLGGMVLGGVSVWTWVIAHRALPRPAFGIVAHLVGALEVLFMVLMLLAWPRC